MTGDPSSFDFEVDVLPAVKTYSHQTSLSCYGRGKKRCDIRIPEIPRSIVSSFSNRNNNVGQLREPTAPKPGRGRARTHRSAVGNEKDDSSSIPGGLHGVKNNNPTDNSSVCSEQSSRSSEHLPSAQTQSSVRNVSDESELQKSQQKSNQSYRSEPKGQENVTDVSPQTSFNHSACLTQGQYSCDSPPLQVLHGWTIHPPRVIQFEGIPINYDMDVIYELLSSYSPIIDWEKKEDNDSVSFRMKFSCADVCDLIELNMDEADFTGTGSHVRCKHLKE